MGKRTIVLSVADGMGGQASGEIAAQTAIDTVKEYCENVFPKLKSITPSVLKQNINQLYQGANRKIREISDKDERNQGLGTTLVIALVIGDKYIVSNVGDSRCYYNNQEEVWQITEDHSEVAEEVRRGTMTEEAAKKSPFRSALYRSLGEEGEVEVDFFPKGDKFSIIDQPCALLICSDGLSNSVNEGDIYENIVGTSDIKKACNNLVSLAYSKGSDDNITVAMAEFGTIKRAKNKIKLLPPPEILARKYAKSKKLDTGLTAKLKIIAAGLTIILISSVGFLLYKIKTSDFTFHNLFQIKKADKYVISQDEKNKKLEEEKEFPSEQKIEEALQEEEIAKAERTEQKGASVEYDPLFKIIPDKDSFLISELSNVCFRWTGYKDEKISYRIEIALDKSPEIRKFVYGNIKNNEIKLSDIIEAHQANLLEGKYIIELFIHKDGKKLFGGKVREIMMVNGLKNKPGEKK